MKYIIGSLIISFGILLVTLILLICINVKAPEGSLKYLGVVWAVLAVFSYPLAKKIIRED